MSDYRITLRIEVEADCLEDASEWIKRQAGKVFKTFSPLEFEKDVRGEWVSMVPAWLKVVLETGDQSEIQAIVRESDALQRRSRFQVVPNEMSA